MHIIKNVVLDNILPGDVYLKARELRFNNDATRVVLLVRINEHNDISTYDVIQNLFPDKTKDFVININELQFVFNILCQNCNFGIILYSKMQK